MKKMLFLLTIGLLFAFLAACGATETPTEEPTPVPPTPEETLQTTSLESILNITWQWKDLVETDPASQSIVPNPENYTLILRADGTTEIKADCNQVLGSYTQQGSALIITMGPSTMAACGEAVPGFPGSGKYLWDAGRRPKTGWRILHHGIR